jgi:enoyl-CoA hydratase/carnithine racemase
MRRHEHPAREREHGGSDRGAIGWMIFNKPARRNAVSLDMWEATPVILDRYEPDPAVRIIVLRRRAMRLLFPVLIFLNLRNPAHRVRERAL